MFTLQPDSKKEVLRIGGGTLVLAAVMVAVFGVLAAFGVIAFDYTVPLAALAGSGVTVLNFTLMCLTMQKAVAVSQDAARVRGIIQLSYNGRMFMMAAWCVAAWWAPCFNFVAGALPLLFPRAVILFLQRTGRYPDGDPLSRQPAAEPEPDASEEK